MAVAKAVCTCKSCGNTFSYRVQEASRRDADDHAAWIEDTYTLCPSCYREAVYEEEKIRAQKNLALFPQLNGTEKQVAWAIVIRDKMYRASRLRKLDLPNDEIIAKCKETLVKNFEGNSNLNKEIYNYLQFFTETEAKWYINHRHDV